MTQSATIGVKDYGLVQARVAGMSYQDIAKKFKLNKSTVWRRLQKPEVKEVIEYGQNEAISLIPTANDVYREILLDTEEKGLRLKAAQDIWKIAGILPSHTQNSFVQNVVNIQNNQVLSPGVMALLTKATDYQDPDCIDVEGEVVE